MDDFKRKIISIYEKKGFSIFRETIWRSSIQHMDLPKIRTFLSQNNINNIDVSLVIPMENNTPRMNWIKYYDKTGQCVSSISEELIPANSNHIKLTFCYVNEEDEKDSETQIIYVVNILRLVFGIPIARELIVIRKFYNDSNQAIRSSDIGFASMFDVQSLNLFDSPPIERLKIKHTSIEAMILLDKAFTQTFPIERFILMWLAFESIINRLPGIENNGKKREKFYKDELKSSIINDEVYRLFQLRCNVFKEGKFMETDIEKECWSLYSVIQLAIMEDCEQRQSFINGFENILSTNT
ncbi:hypothetical protein [Aliarcobacter butzleri]|uniref:hypothetical protein n=1 Tax=Aliarcobacter butzleri TaxID=28197 RepID=UPI00189FC09D|nr:hypothetical protein [Aliarcobacter butzleri]MBF7065121.1 hypothetical protein [Aliarcobacter butzleri]